MLTDPVELGAWLRLVHRPGLGRDRMRRLLAAFGSAAAVAEADASALRPLVGEACADELATAAPGHQALLERTLAWLDAGPQRHVLALGDPQFPAPLLETADPPLLLYLEGRVELLARPCLAIVGSRRPTPQGLDHARTLARQLSRGGWTVVSGLAAGIDGAAHEGALEGDGSTVAVVGTGLDQVYPRRHAALARRVALQGLLVSEFPIGAPPLAAHFPRRNRIIAGLTRGTLVVEAAPKSGSLITARLAAEAGREVFAIPGSILSEQSRGCHALLREGAKLVETVEDIVHELAVPAMPTRVASPITPAAADIAGDDGPADPVLEALGHDPVSLDALMARCGWAAPALNARLMELELDGQVARLAGGLYQRQRRA